MRLDPIIPFEPVLTEEVPEGEEWVAQVKWDGVRILSYYDGNSFRLFNRKRHERTMQYSELQALPALMEGGSFVLDGEVIALGEKGTPSFHRVLQRDRSRTGFSRHHPAWMQDLPIYYMVFDLLHWNGEWLFDLPFERRTAMLHQHLRATESILPVETFSSPIALQKAVIQQDLEGIVIKKKGSLYLPGGKDGRWLKWKKKGRIEALVGGMLAQDGQLRSLLLGIKEGRGLAYIGRVGTGGLKGQERAVWYDLLWQLRTGESPFFGGHRFQKQTLFLKPLVTVAVRYLEWTEEGRLRQPVLERIMPLGMTEGRGVE